MEQFRLSITPMGITASELKTELKNDALFSALLDPLSVFLQDVSQQREIEGEVSIQTNRADELGLVFGQFLFRAFDLNRLGLEMFIELEIGARVNETFAAELGMPASSRVMTGIEKDEQGQPFGFRIETIMDGFELPYVPRQPWLRGAWLCFSQLWLEDQLGRRLPEVKARVEAHIGPSLEAALPRIESGELRIDTLADDLEQRYRISRDLSAALMQLPDWLAGGGAERIARLKQRGASQGR